MIDNTSPIAWVAVLVLLTAVLGAIGLALRKKGVLSSAPVAVLWTLLTAAPLLCAFYLYQVAEPKGPVGPEIEARR